MLLAESATVGDPADITPASTLNPNPELIGVPKPIPKYWLAIEREWVSVGELQADIIPTISISQLLESLEYLQGRSLIEKNGGKFTQQAVVMEYTIDKLLTTVRTEIRD